MRHTSVDPDSDLNNAVLIHNELALTYQVNQL